MYDQERIKPYGEQGDKASQVEAMFDQIAPTYDKLNHRLSWDIDRRWRQKAIAQLRPFAPRDILDVATGTGDFALLAAKALKPTRLVGVDISEGMMAIARTKAEAEELGCAVTFQKADCMALPFADASFDAATTAFGIRNFADLERGLREICRVLRTGGHLSMVELTTPVAFPMKQLFHVYSHTVLPMYGRMVSGDGKAYAYLTATIEAFPQGEAMTEILRGCGFSSATFKRLTGGICTMYLATK